MNWKQLQKTPEMVAIQTGLNEIMWELKMLMLGKTAEEIEKLKVLR